MRQLRLSVTKATNGRGKGKDVALQSSVTLLIQNIYNQLPSILGLVTLELAQWCYIDIFRLVKRFSSALTTVLRPIFLQNLQAHSLPYLYGVCIADNTPVVSFHGP